MKKKPLLNGVLTTALVAPVVGLGSTLIIDGTIASELCPQPFQQRCIPRNPRIEANQLNATYGGTQALSYSATVNSSAPQSFVGMAGRASIQVRGRSSSLKTS